MAPLCLAINSYSEGSNGKRMLLESTWKTNIEVGPALTYKWTDLMACTLDEMEGVLSMLL